MNPYVTFLVREAILYENLLTLIANSLKQVVKASNGDYLFDRDIWVSLLIGDTPKLWLNSSYPSCKKTVPNYIIDLIKRLDFVLSMEHSADRGLDISYLSHTSLWFSGFYDQ